MPSSQSQEARRGHPKDQRLLGSHPIWTVQTLLYELRPAAALVLLSGKKKKQHYLLCRGQKTNCEDWLNSTLSKSTQRQGGVKVWA